MVALSAIKYSWIIDMSNEEKYLKIAQITTNGLMFIAKYIEGGNASADVIYNKIELIMIKLNEIEREALL
jgi:hypothetical protein